MGSDHFLQAPWQLWKLDLDMSPVGLHISAGALHLQPQDPGKDLSSSLLSAHSVLKILTCIMSQ